MNVHPLIIHFPIALLIIGVIFDAIGILGKRHLFVQMGYFLFALGALSAIPAALTGNDAAETAQHIASIQNDLEWHDTLGTATALLAVLLTLLRTHFTFKKQFTQSAQYLYLFLAALVALLVGASGYTGGHLVYEHGAGTKPIIKTLKIDSQTPSRIPRSDTFQSQ